MHNISAKNIVLIGSIAGLISSVIYLLAPLPRGMVVLVQIVAIIASGAGLGYYFKSSLPNSYAITICSMLMGYGMIRVFPFIAAYWSIVVALLMVLGTGGVSFLWSKYFALKIPSMVRYGGAVFIIFIWWLIIPLAVLYFLRSASMT